MEKNKLEEEQKLPEKQKCTHQGGYIGVGQNIMPTHDAIIVVTTCLCQFCGAMFTNSNSIKLKTSPLATPAGIIK